MYCDEKMGQFPGIIGTGIDIVGGIFGGKPKTYQDVKVQEFQELGCREAQEMAAHLNAVATPQDWQRLFNISNQMGARHFAAAANAMDPAMAANIWYEQCRAMTSPYQRPANDPIVMWFREMLDRPAATVGKTPPTADGGYVKPSAGPVVGNIALPLMVGAAALLLLRK